MDSQMTTCSISPDFGGSFKGNYELSLNQQKNVELEFNLDLINLIDEQDAIENIIQCWDFIKLRHKLPDMKHITVNTDKISIKTKAKNINEISLYLWEDKAHLGNSEGSSSLVNVKIETFKRRMKQQTTEVNDLAKSLESKLEILN